MWNESLESAAASNRSNGYIRYLDALERGDNINTEMLEEAFNAVNSRFLPSARALGFNISQVHHWNFNKGSFPTQIVDPRHLVPTPSRSVHTNIHRSTTIDPTNIWRGPVDQQHVIEIPNFVTPLNVQ